MTSIEAKAYLTELTTGLAELRAKRATLKAEFEESIRTGAGGITSQMRARLEESRDAIGGLEMARMRAEITLLDARTAESEATVAELHQAHEKAVKALERAQAAERGARYDLADLTNARREWKVRAGQLRHAVSDRIAAQLQASKAELTAA